jgi:hypothetical protein
MAENSLYVPGRSDPDVDSVAYTDPRNPAKVINPWPEEKLRGLTEEQIKDLTDIKIKFAGLTEVIKDLKSNNLGIIKGFKNLLNTKESNAQTLRKEEDKVEREEEQINILNSIYDVLTGQSTMLGEMKKFAGGKKSGGMLDWLLDFASNSPLLAFLGIPFALKLFKTVKEKLLSPEFAKKIINTAWKTATTVFKWAGIITGVITLIYDGVMGWLNSEKWGVSKTSGIISSIIGGAAEGGLLNAFTNMGKWAGIGAAVGSVVPFFGTFTGGLIGAVFGAITGWLGSGYFAKEWFAPLEKWILDMFGPNLFQNMGGFAVGGAIAGSIFPIGGTLIGGLVGAGIGALISWLDGDFFQRWSGPFVEWCENKLDEVGKSMRELMSDVVNVWNENVGPMNELFQEFIVDPLDKYIIKPIKDLSEWWDKLNFEFPLIDPIENFLTDLKDFFMLFSGIDSVVALYKFLTGRNRTFEEDKEFKPEKIGVENLGQSSKAGDLNAQNRLTNQIKTREDFKPLAYEEKYQNGELIKDGDNQKYAVGYGFNYLPKEREVLNNTSALLGQSRTFELSPVEKGEKITKEQADRFLEYLLKKNKKGVDVKLSDIVDVLDPVRKNALYEMAYQMGLGKETKLDDGTIQRTGLLGFKNMLSSLRLLKNADSQEEKQKILSDVAAHARDSDWYREQTTNRAKKVIHELVTGQQFNSKSHDESQITPKPGSSYNTEKLQKIVESGKNLFNSQYKIPGMSEKLSKEIVPSSAGFIAKKPEIIMTGEYSGAGENPEVTIQMNALENRLLATSKRLFEMRQDMENKDNKILTSTFENKLEKTIENTRISEERVRMKDMIQRNAMQIQMPSWNSVVDNKVINNTSNPILIQKTSRNEHNPFRIS